MCGLSWSGSESGDPSHSWLTTKPSGFFYTSVSLHILKIGRSKTTKHYGVVFTCLNTRAVHLELATDCSTMELMQVLRRFFAVRGLPALMISDNRLQMVGQTKRILCRQGELKWKFATPAAPHQNGCAEALVKSCKLTLKKAIGDQVLTPFELHTCLLEVANLVNQHPIGRIPNDPDDGSYLCLLFLFFSKICVSKLGVRLI